MFGKTFIPIVVIFGLIFIITAFVLNFRSDVILQEAGASSATTSVTVLNTPPTWSVPAQESPESSVANPTNAGSNANWIATADDPNQENYYLLICSTNASATPYSLAPPRCATGTIQWAISPSTVAGTQATAATTTLDSWAESNNWHAFICDANQVNPKCNNESQQGSGNTASPFVVNHRPLFTIYSDDSPKNPGQLVTWTSNASDTDIFGGQDQVKLFVCKTAGFSGSSCTGETYCSSTFVNSDPTCSFTLENIKQDKNYTAFGYVIDNHNFVASTSTPASTKQGTDSILTVANVAPTISSSSISLLDVDEIGELTLTTLEGTSTGFKVKFIVQDSNSCLNSSGGNEITASIINVFMEGTNCTSSSQYNANICYPDEYATWNPVCVQDTSGPDTCGGATDDTVGWTCTFPLMYHSNPTVGSSATISPWWDKKWFSSARATDDNSATSSLISSSDGNDVDILLGFSLNTDVISYGSWEPGQGNDNTDRPTEIKATGNVGLDENLSGNPMCTTYPSCPGASTNTIAISQQRYASSTIAWGSAIAASSSPVEFEINNPKTTLTYSPATSTTFWGIQVPSSITLAGDYTGLNTIVAVTGEGQNW